MNLFPGAKCPFSVIREGPYHRKYTRILMGHQRLSVIEQLPY